ncbi:MAG TPA: carboxypeptidase regulatory-like domain-containing protein [Thermoanaerobaculia bacterium]|nr:carboxypeptidase regulatory-like domain-containing protein [Thermoanaerobaculia bacterium]
MARTGWIGLLAVLVVAAMAVAANNAAVDVPAVQISGMVTDDGGKPMRGAMVSAVAADGMHSVTVYSQPDGSFRLDGLAMGNYKVRARLLGRADAWQDVGQVHQAKDGVALALAPVSGLDLQMQRPGNELLDLLHWDNEADALNFKMMCAYCHQVGTVGFRSPEEPVDWEVMLTRMDGFQGLYKHTQEALVDKLVGTYGRDEEKKWPAFTAPEPPAGETLKAEVNEWLMGKENDAMIHDLELGRDGLVYIVDMTADALQTLDPRTGERKTYSVPGGKEYDSTDTPIKGPHSIEEAPDGSMWIPLSLSGEFARFDTKTKEWIVVPAHEAPRPRGGYPHTHRFDQKGILWYTDAALGVFRLDPATYDAEANRYDIKYYKLPSADQVRGGGARGESRGVTPYGLDIAPDGMVWYSKLNGQRIGRIDPNLPDDHPEKIVEWQPPVHGPRRFMIAPDGKLWIPGWASGDIASFDPKSEEWKVYPMPKGKNSLPYALGVEPKTGHVWICGTGTDSMVRFDPKTETFTEYPLPTRVTYTREVEFDDDGNVWVTNSNYPVRHVENSHGSIIKVTPIAM